MKIMYFLFCKEHFVWLFFTVLFCSLILITSCREDDNNVASLPVFSEEDVRHEENLNTYLQQNYSCVIHQVSVSESFIEITGEYTGEGNFFLGEIPPYMDIMKQEKVPDKIKLVNPQFQVELERFVERDGFLYDRLLSKWAIFKEGGR